MGQLRRVQAVLRQFDTSFDSSGVRREDTSIFVPEAGIPELHLYLRSSEVSGVWLMRYEIAWKCLRELLEGGLIESREVTLAGEEFVLSQKGRERLRKP